MLCFLALGAPSFGQDSANFTPREPRETYLVIRIHKQNDQRADKIYYTIEAEPFNDYALDLYDLVAFNKNYFVPKPGVAFYYNRPDTATLYYNHFKSETEALDFMGKLKWTLVTVLSETAPAGDRAPYTAVTSRTVYYFKKTVDY